MRRIALHRLDQVRDQVVALLELHVDVGKGLVDALAECNQPVIRTEGEQHENDDNAENDPAGRHGVAPEGITTKSSLTKLAAGDSGEVGIVLVARKAGF